MNRRCCINEITPTSRIWKKKKVKLFGLLLIGSFLFGYNIIHAQEFMLYDSWDFENQELGSYTSSDIEDDFDVVTNYHHNSGSIVMDTINGIATKVLKVTHEANKLSVGFDLDARLSQDFDEVYLSYNIKLSEEFNSTAGGKLPGLGGLPVVTANKCPTSSQGFLCKSMYKRSGSMITYHYDRTSQWCPWASENYKYNKIYMNNGCWYNITRRVVMNTFTDGVANKDGIHEIWVDGRMIFQENNIKFMDIENDTLKIDDLNIAHFYGGGTDDYKPMTECYGYFDNFKVYIPTDDSIYQQKLHDPSTILSTPNEITNRTVYYDSLITTEGTFSNTEYGAAYSPCIDEAYLIDAGEGNTVTVEITGGGLGNGDYLFFYDGNTTDANLIKKVEGAASGTRQSAGRYMFVRFSTDRLQTGTGWTGTISFQNETSGFSEKKDNTNEKIKVLPNPGSNTISFLGINNKARLAIFDILGKKILFRESIRDHEPLDIGTLPMGTYTIVLEDNCKHTLKFLKN